MRRGLSIAGVITVLAAWNLVMFWSALGLPPPVLLLEYGPAPTGGPTGDSVVIGGTRFVEVERGYLRFDCRVWVDTGDPLGVLARTAGMEAGSPPMRAYRFVDRWIEVAHDFWITAQPIGLALTPEARPLALRSPDGYGLLSALSRAQGGYFSCASADQARLAMARGVLDEAMFSEGCYWPSPISRGNAGWVPLGDRFRGHTGKRLESAFSRWHPLATTKAPREARRAFELERVRYAKHPELMTHWLVPARDGLLIVWFAPRIRE